MKLTLKKLALASLLSIASVGASAADIITNLGNLPLPTQTPYSAVHAAGESPFFDDYTFTITAGFASSVTTSVELSNFFGLSNLRARIYAGNTHETGLVAPGTFSSSWGTSVAVGNVGITTVTLDPVSLVAGTYTLQIRGTVTGSSGGSYAGILSITPVPEADTYAMLVAGLGLMGGIARRKTNA